MDSLLDFYLQPGYIYANDEGSLVKTVLGSCVAVCLWDQRQGFGGMNHYIYPRRVQKPPRAEFGDVSIPYLIKLMKKIGSDEKDLLAHIVGGAANPLLSSNIGQENIAVAEEILERYGITVVNRSVGGNTGKKVVFNTASGELLIYSCMQVREDDWYE
ncbi:MAG: chemotaxis protein CheD [Chitinophagales bacterium]